MAEPSIGGVNKILVIGAGAMGSQIGMVCSLAGYEVVVHVERVKSYAPKLNHVVVDVVIGAPGSTYT